LIYEVYTPAEMLGRIEYLWLTVVG
jgi:hypothetical protein